MHILAPSLLAADFARLGEQIRETEESGAQYLHIDVMDGVFVPSISFGMPLIKSIRPVSSQFFDVHLMIINPERYIREFVECGADGITFHLEAVENAGDVIDMIHAAGAKAGISIRPGTAIEAVYPYLTDVELALIMSVEPGFGGQQFMPESYGRISQLRDYIDKHSFAVRIEVDGGIGKNNVQKVIRVGADICVAGSAIFEKYSINHNIYYFMKMLKEND